MKATITSTYQVVDMKDPRGRTAAARVWEGVTEGGVPFVAYIMMVQVATNLDQPEFERSLKEHSAPSADTVRAIDARFIL